VISAEIEVFPNNIISLMADRFRTLDEDLSVFSRRLRTTDPNESIGLFAQQWLPTENSYEMRGPFPSSSEPTLNRYMIVIEGFVKDGSEEKGLARHAVLAKLIRGMLYRDTTLGISLRALSVNLFDSIERTQRYGILTQRYISSEVTGSFLYLSALDFWLETETV
jgi:hypothetical protein